MYIITRCNQLQMVSEIKVIIYLMITTMNPFSCRGIKIIKIIMEAVSGLFRPVARLHNHIFYFFKNKHRIYIVDKLLMFQLLTNEQQFYFHLLYTNEIY